MPNLSFLHLTQKINNKFHRFIDKRIMNYRLKKARLPLANSIPTWTVREELKALYDLAVACPPCAQAMEIGSYLGASTCYLAAGLSQGKGTLICVDTWQNETMPEGERDTFAEFHRNTKAVKSRIRLVRKRSEDLVDDDIDGSLNLIFLDGDHSYESTKRDFDYASKRISADGTIAFHDVLCFEGVSRVVGEALSSGEWVIKGQVRNLIWIGKAEWLERTYLA